MKEVKEVPVIREEKKVLLDEKTYFKIGQDKISEL